MLKGSISKSAWKKPGWAGRARHLAYARGWKKFEPLWDWIIRLGRVGSFLPVLEKVLEGKGLFAEPVGASEHTKGRGRGKMKSMSG